MTLASALVTTPPPVGFSTDFVDPNAPTALSSALLGLPQAQVPRQMIVQRAPDQPPPSAAAGNGAPAADGSGQVPTDMLAQALVKNSFPTGPMYSPLEPLGRLAELFAGNRSEQGYLQARQKAVADFGNSLGSGDIAAALTAGMNSPLPEIQSEALKTKMGMMVPQIGSPNPVSGISTVMQDGRVVGTIDPAGNFKPLDGQVAGGAAAGPAAAGGGSAAPVEASTMPSTQAAAAGGSNGQQPPGSDVPTLGGSPDGIWQRQLQNGHSVLVNKYTGESKSDPADVGPTAQTLRQELATQNQQYSVVRDAYGQVQANFIDGGKSGNAATDAGLMYNYMKTINPLSAIRPNTLALSSDIGGGITQDMIDQYNHLLRGDTLGAPTRISMAATAARNYSVYDKTRQNTENSFASIGQKMGIPRGWIVPDATGGIAVPAGATTMDMPPAPIPIDQAVPQLKSAVAAGGPDAQAAMNEFDQAYGQGAAQQALQSSMAQAPATQRPTLGAMVPQLPPATNPMRAYPPGAP